MTLFTVNHKNNNKKYIVKNGDTRLSPEKFALYIRGCVQNKRKSQKEIYKSFYQHAMIVCAYYAPHPEEAVEILNEGFLKIFSQVIKYSPVYIKDISSFSGWLRKVMLDTAIDRFERDKQSYRPSSSKVCV
jgi:RNA polymerase sigma-70 factor (ECF subfamily)